MYPKKRARECIETADNDLAIKISAELNGIIHLYKGQIIKNADYHLLLCTDTWLGEQTAGLIAQWLSKQGIQPEIKRMPDLQTRDITSFQLALSEIVRWCDETITGYRHNNYHVVFNLTGGFKSVQGFLQTLSMFYADESIYIFETSSELLRIPRLPIEMNEENTIISNLSIFRRLSMHLPVSQISNIPETLLLKLDNIIALSPWGEILWKQTKRKIYARQLYESPSEKLKFGPKFERSITKKKLPSDRLIMINEKIDQLTEYLETNKQNNLASLDFKQLQADPCPPSTHEIDAWADQDAKRIYGHYDNQVFVLDRLDQALH